MKNRLRKKYLALITIVKLTNGTNSPHWFEGVFSFGQYLIVATGQEDDSKNNGGARVCREKSQLSNQPVPDQDHSPGRPICLPTKLRTRILQTLEE